MSSNDPTPRKSLALCVTNGIPWRTAHAAIHVMTVDGRREYIEIKQCGKLGRFGKQVNQIRVIEYICCAVWAPNRDCWYVISPDQLVSIATRKERGQHTEIPFECMNLTLRFLDENHNFCMKCKDGDLAQTVTAAIRRGRDNKVLSCLMHSLLVEIQSLRDEYLKRVQSEIGT